MYINNIDYEDYSTWASTHRTSRHSPGRDSTPLPVIVMVSTLEHIDCGISGTVDQAMFVINPTGPVPGQFPHQRLGLANALKRRAQAALNQFVQALERFSVLSCPVQIILPTRRCKVQATAHASSLGTSVLRFARPASSSAMDWCKCRRFSPRKT